MAESADILTADEVKVILPDLSAGCSMADMAAIDQMEEAWERMAEALAGSSDPIFHWTGYDRGVLNATAPDDVKAALAPRFVDLHRAFSQAVRFPVDGTSRKRVAAYLGYQWRAYESWFAAWEDYRAWLRTGHDDALERSLAYQMDDVIALGKVWEWLAESR